jgi:tripartite-type tricarboxylate transporter receptor subunit TctC
MPVFSYISSPRLIGVYFARQKQKRKNLMYVSVAVRLVLFCLLFCISVLTITRANATEMIVPFGPGGPSDQLARALINALPINQYQIAYKPGGSGRIGVRSILGRTAMMMAATPTIFVTNRLMFEDLEYDADRDLEVLAVIAVMPNLLVCHHSTGFKTVKDLMSSTRPLNFSASGVGANDHIATALLLRQWPNRHEVIQYSQGGGNRLTDLLSGVTDCMFANYPLVKPHINDARLNVMLSSEDIGLAAPVWHQQFGFPYPFRSVMAVIVSRQLDQPTKHRMRSDLITAMSSVGLSQKISDMGFVPILKVDARSINETAIINQRLADFITRFQMRLK